MNLQPDPKEVDRYLVYIDALRLSGAVNMHSVPRLLMMDFDFDRETADRIFQHWTDTFAERHPEEV